MWSTYALKQHLFDRPDSDSLAPSAAGVTFSNLLPNLTP